ncbi:MAG: beta-ketoacyl-[acyl-carrier-protein] synthase II [Elusimicrobiota bacterium]|nr:beta-ketoacyl-[acyl-carrier-protein] synthase II [Elusimicrobiota bacterium]MDH5661993.1 beta-ketoacyl-[acyl-carrier-protein] synthase II [Elusimicrobiota bacterium]
MKQRVVVTGLGVIAPNGIGKDNYWIAIKEGRSGISRVTKFDVSKYPTRIAGEVNEFDPEKYMSKRKARFMSRCAQFALASAKMAIEDSGLELSREDRCRVGIALGTAIGGLQIAEEQCEIFHEKGVNGVSPFSAMTMNPNAGVGVITVELRLGGPNVTIVTGCSAGLNAIGYAFDTICNDKADIMIAVGAEAPLFPFTFDSFCVAHVLSRRNGDPGKASRPFERFRDGYVLSEGAGAVILEKMEHAVERGAKIYGEVAGYGITNDRYSMYKMEPTGREVARTMRIALDSAGLAPEDVNYINAHGSSSLVADKRETRAVRLAFGNYAYKIPVSSIKSMIGQPLAATGSIQFITAALAIENNCLPPTINYEEPDPDCDLDYVPNQSRAHEVRVAMVNSFGQGGNNVSAVLKRYEGV